jgi:transcription-repair coupling factor (superfamily II helicase)
MRIGDWVRSIPSHPRFAGPTVHENCHQAWTSLADEAKPFLIASEFHRNDRKIVIVAPTYERCLKWQARLAMCGVPDSQIHQLPDGISALFEDSAPEHIALSDRIGALRALVDPYPAIVIAAPGAALERTLPLDVLEEVFLEIQVGLKIEPDQIVRRLKRLGYEAAEPVRIPGQMSQRGGILDVFLSGFDAPVRIEFFGDEIDSLRTFDANSQRSTGKLSAIGITPSRETLLPEDAKAFSDLLRHSLEQEAASLDDSTSARLMEIVGGDIKAIELRSYFDRIDLYRPLLHPDSGCALDLLGEEGLVVLDEPLELEAIAARTYEELANALESRAQRGEILHAYPNDYLFSSDHLGSFATTVALSSQQTMPGWLMPEHDTDLEISSLEPYRGRVEVFVPALKRFSEENLTVVFASDQSSRAKTMLSQIDVFPQESEPDDPGAYLLHGNLAGGFIWPEAKLAVVTDAELFGVGRLRLPQRRFLEGAPVATVLDLKPGDFVVHIHFGIGIFRGLVRKQIEGMEREFLFIEYAPPDKLFVPADQLDRVQKYLNPGEAAPKINRLTGTEWQKTIAKAKEDARAFAQDLVKLYAERQIVQRRAFGPDSTWQSEMESTFPWIETPSQMQAIRDVKADLQSPNPMDRLVCGDVGFGKTEVAIRAAFKVVQENRQVAILCPTTILSEQHFRNFAERLNSFGVRVAVLNRFVSTSERHDTLSKLKVREIDILIGTHALLSKEIIFKELGLVVIDEEQKFGVKQKEVLKKLRSEVDVLSMSATPIPRTLSMALMDIRQMSLINDPPPGRLPVRSYVRPYSKEVIREAILRELARGGQVFYVYNRVQGIQHIAQMIQKLVPNARIGVGHGQMHEHEIEPIMVGFVRGEIDVLISTSIIENGIDISNANTLIVENADRFGLSQLYQLKGRVGRSDRQAYSYFLYESNKDLNEAAMQRLQALQEFGTLGAGYSLAFRDLQIRGAGELLGAKQSGAMTAVGYELYSQLINEQVELLKNAVDGSPKTTDVDEAVFTSPLPAFDIPADAHLPESYIGDAAHRLYFYQQMMKVRSLEALGEVRAELVDRYGPLPDQATAAFQVIHLRIQGRKLGIEKLEAAGGRIATTIRNRGQISPIVISMLSRRNRDAYFTRDQLIWPYVGQPLEAVERMVGAMESAIEEVEESRVSTS